MNLLNTFDPLTTAKTLARLENLANDTKPAWGNMNAAQMLAHLSVAYDLAYGLQTHHPSFFAKLMLRLFVKDIVVGESKAYPKNSRTAPNFVIADARDFEKEKARLIAHIKDTEAKGSAYFEGKESSAFGKLTARQWSVQFYKHLDHHFTQFGI